MGYLYAENGNILFAQAQAVILLAIHPFFHVHDQVNRLAQGDCAYAIHGTDINDANAANLHKVANHLRAFPRKAVVGNPANVHHVIRHQLMAALDQLQRSLAFAHAAFAGQQHAHAVYIHQHAMPGYPRGQATVKIVNGGKGELGGDHIGLVNGNVPRGGGLQKIIRRRHAPADDYAG